MVVHVYSLAFNGIDVTPVDVQVQISNGIPAFTIVGLADKTIAESRERVKAALAAMGLALPAKKILINLAPADLIKEGSHFDLAIACGVLAAMEVIDHDIISNYLIAGELSLDGEVLPVAGVLPAAIGASRIGKGLICPAANGSEAAWSGSKDIIAASSILSLINHFKGTQVISPPSPAIHTVQSKAVEIADIIGQDCSKRALEIAAAGGHSLLMVGAPGAGKSMLAQSLPAILPPMSSAEILETSMIYSVAGVIEDGALMQERAFRAPHHSCSMAAMIGGGVGRRMKPGEVSLAHNGVLFLDELPEFPSNVIDALRQPLETKEVLVARASAHVKFPANFQLIAAMNPCKCGYLYDEHRACSKVPKCGMDYQMKISGPIIDRFDIHIEVPSIEHFGSGNVKNGDSSQQVRERIISARQKQIERLEGYGITSNNMLDGQILLECATPDNAGLDLLNDAANKFRMSMRGYNRVLRVARTIADLDGSNRVSKIHLAEALSYRNTDYRLIGSKYK